MKLKDFVYDPELRKANIMLEEVEPIQLENLLMILRDEEEEKDDNQTDYLSIIFGETT